MAFLWVMTHKLTAQLQKGHLNKDFLVNGLGLKKKVWEALFLDGSQKVFNTFVEKGLVYQRFFFMISKLMLRDSMSQSNSWIYGFLQMYNIFLIILRNSLAD